MLLGATLLSGIGQWIVLFPVGLIVFEVKIRIEERLMVATFPDEYPGTAAGCPSSSPGYAHCVNATQPAPTLDRLPWKATRSEADEAPSPAWTGRQLARRCGSTANAELFDGPPGREAGQRNMPDGLPHRQPLRLGQPPVDEHRCSCR
jgi:hypothetical protein